MNCTSHSCRSPRSLPLSNNTKQQLEQARNQTRAQLEQARNQTRLGFLSDEQQASEARARLGSLAELTGAEFAELLTSATGPALERLLESASDLSLLLGYEAKLADERERVAVATLKAAAAERERAAAAAAQLESQRATAFQSFRRSFIPQDEFIGEQRTALQDAGVSISRTGFRRQVENTPEGEARDVLLGHSRALQEVLNYEEQACCATQSGSATTSVPQHSRRSQTPARTNSSDSSIPFTRLSTVAAKNA